MVCINKEKKLVKIYQSYYMLIPKFWLKEKNINKVKMVIDNKKITIYPIFENSNSETEKTEEKKVCGGGGEDGNNCDNKVGEGSGEV